MNPLLLNYSGFTKGHTKGQIISKGLFGVLEFSNKMDKHIRSSSKNEFVCSFLGVFKDTKSPFEII